MVTRAERLVYEAVLDRDRLMYWDSVLKGWLTRHQSFEAWLMSDPWICVARLIDPRQSVNCSGEMTRDHVHEHTGGTKAKRPPTTMETVVILCQAHHLNSRWATSHRPEIRTYIKEANERYKLQ